MDNCIKKGEELKGRVGGLTHRRRIFLSGPSETNVHIKYECRLCCWPFESQTATAFKCPRQGLSNAAKLVSNGHRVAEISVPALYWHSATRCAFPHTHTSVFTRMHSRTPPPKTFVSHQLTTSWVFSFPFGAYPRSNVLSVVRHAGKQLPFVGSKVHLPLSVSACDFPRFFETGLCYVYVVCR